MQKLKGVILQWAPQTKEMEKLSDTLGSQFLREAFLNTKGQVSATWPAASMAVVQDLFPTHGSRAGAAIHPRGQTQRLRTVRHL